jgi:integrase
MAKTFQQQCESAKSGKVWDQETPGLYLRVGTRAKTWGFHKYGKPRASFGRYPQVTVEEARQRARETAGYARTEWSVNYVLEKLEARARAKNNRRPQYIRQLIERHSPEFLSMGLHQITKPLIHEKHGRIGGPVAGHYWVKAIRTLFNFAINQLDYPGKNTAKGVDTTPSKPRTRVLTPAELDAFLARAKEESEYWHSYFYVLAHTGARRDNVEQMRWQDLDLVKGVWVIPASHFKTKEAHTVHLTPGVVAALQGRTVEGARVWPRTAHTWNVFDKLRGGADYTMHDFRRTVGSRLASKGVNLQTVAAILGHKTVSTTMRHYTVVDEAAIRAALT